MARCLKPSRIARTSTRILPGHTCFRHPIRPSGSPCAAAGKPIGAGTHTDYGNLTLLTTDDVGGPEVGTWAEK